MRAQLMRKNSANALIIVSFRGGNRHHIITILLDEITYYRGGIIQSIINYFVGMEPVIHRYSFVCAQRQLIDNGVRKFQADRYTIFEIRQNVSTLIDYKIFCQREIADSKIINVEFLG